MRIISDFKDYYDRHERSEPIYVRKTRELDDISELRALEHLVEGLRTEHKWIRTDKNILVDVHPCVLVFCGKAYVWYECKVPNLRRFDDHDSLMNFVGNEKWSYWAKERANSRDEWQKLLLKDVSSINHAYSSPIVLVRKVQRARFSYGNSGISSVSVTIDPRLKDLDFGRLVSADQCHQEIEMFVGGVLSLDGPEPRPTTDKEKLIAHGMDVKWSFRNPDPPKRKRKK